MNTNKLSMTIALTLSLMTCTVNVFAQGTGPGNGTIDQMVTGEKLIAILSPMFPGSGERPLEGWNYGDVCSCKIFKRSGRNAISIYMDAWGTGSNLLSVSILENQKYWYSFTSNNYSEIHSVNSKEGLKLRIVKYKTNPARKTEIYLAGYLLNSRGSPISSGVSFEHICAVK